MDAENGRSRGATVQRVGDRPTVPGVRARHRASAPANGADLDGGLTMSWLRVGFAILLLAHGIAHLPGLLGAWRLATFPELPYHTTLLAGRLDVGDGGMRVMGALWLVVALAFVAAATGAFLGRGWWTSLAVAAALASLALCALEWPAARIGAVVNGVILGGLLVGQRAGGA
jgi:hypothetical protein